MPWQGPSLVIHLRLSNSIRQSQLLRELSNGALLVGSAIWASPTSIRTVCFMYGGHSHKKKDCSRSGKQPRQFEEFDSSEGSQGSQHVAPTLHPPLKRVVEGCPTYGRHHLGKPCWRMIGACFGCGCLSHKRKNCPNRAGQGQ